MTTEEPPRRFWPSMAALGAGLVAIVVLSLGTDELMRWLGLFPPGTEAPKSDGTFLLALGYRSLYAIFGSYLTAKLAPRRPMRHAIELGVVGLLLGAAGVFASWNAPEMGPRWYAIALALIALPCGWLGGLLHRRLQPPR